MSDRPSVLKTYKLYVGGKFPRSESGRSYQPRGCPRVNVARGSRKDLRDAIAVARKGLADWSGRTGYNRGQILYRLAEMMEARAGSLRDEIVAGGGVRDAEEATREVEQAIDLCTWYAGLPDKLTSLLGSQNDVSGPFFNFSGVEPTGVVGVVAPQTPSLSGLLALVLPVLAGGNSVVALVSEEHPLVGLGLGEILAVSDVPAGAVNLIAGLRQELVMEMANHRDVDGLLLSGEPDPAVGAAASDSVTRVRWAPTGGPTSGSLDWVNQFVELKTFWHPVAP